MSDETPGRFARVRAQAQDRFATLRREHPGLRHILEAWGLLQRNNGNQYAAAITYFSFLALFPLLLLAVAVLGFVLSSDPSLQRSLLDHVTQNVPGSFGDTLKSSIRTAIKARTGVGIVGLVGVVLTGLGWIGNLRGAIDAVWGLRPAKTSFIGGRVANLLVLVGLGAGLLVSLGLTAIGTALTTQILSAVGLDDVPGSAFVLKILGILIAVGGDMVIFWWLLIRLPAVDVPRGIALRGALLAAAGFEVLKIVGTYTIAHTATSPTAGPFAGVLAILIWIQLVARWMLFCCAWTATLTAEHHRQQAVQRPPDFVPKPSDGGAADEVTVSPAAVGVTLVGAGAVAGAVATVAITKAIRDRAT